MARDPYTICLNMWRFLKKLIKLVRNICFILLSWQVYLHKDLKAQVKPGLNRTGCKGWTGPDHTPPSFLPTPSSIHSMQASPQQGNRPASLPSGHSTRHQPLLDMPWGPGELPPEAWSAPGKTDLRKRSSWSGSRIKGHVVRELQKLGLWAGRSCYPGGLPALRAGACPEQGQVASS